MSNKDQKIQVSVGCTDFLISEVESLRRQNELQGAQLRIVDNFFGMINRIGDKPSQGFGTDPFWQAKQEIRKATDEANTVAGQP